MSNSENSKESIARWCAAYVANALNVNAASVDTAGELDSFGLDSSLVTSMVFELQDRFGIDIPVSVVFENNTLDDVAADISARISASIPAMSRG